MTDTAPPSAALRKLRVIETAKEAYARVFGNLHLLVRAALVPFALSLALIVLSFTVPLVSVLGYLIGILDLLPYTLFGVAWHRLTLLGPVAAAPPLRPAWARRHWRFLGYLLAVMLLFYLLAMAIILVSGQVLGGVEVGDSLSGLQWFVLIAAAPALLIGGPYLVLRLSFVFPATSVDEDYGLRHARTHTKGQGLRLLGATVIVAVPMGMLIWAVSALLGALLFTGVAPATGQDGVSPIAQMAAFVDANLGALMLTQAITTAINYVLMALMVSVISIAFRICTGWVPAGGGMVIRGNGES